MADRDDTDLEDLFAAARALRPEPSPDLMARILADADAIRRERVPPEQAPAVSRRGWLAAVAGVLGGWPALGTLAASVVLGLGLGVAGPAGLPALTSTVWGDEVSVATGLLDDPLSLLDG